MCNTNERLVKLQIMFDQTHAIDAKTPVPCGTEHCEKGITEPIYNGYRCLYCDIIYCRSCAEKHFGKTVKQYREEERRNAQMATNNADT